MPIYADELIKGSQEIEGLMEENNNKFSNHLLMSDDEQ